MACYVGLARDAARLNCTPTWQYVGMRKREKCDKINHSPRFCKLLNFVTRFARSIPPISGSYEMDLIRVFHKRK